MIRYRGRIVAVPETALICVGYMLFHDARLRASCPDDIARFTKLDEEWHERATKSGVGCVDLRLEQILEENPERESEFLGFIDAVHQTLHAFGDTVPSEYVDRVIARGIREYKGKSLKSAWFHKVLDLMKRLIRGEEVGVQMQKPVHNTP